ncbi:hypothetical protein VTN00DRAFT_2233 [Thermoascus crustaceus]|uniref:uncharacterized protein n=1 Tax=Thermoascus crustaceus TaxID=5088 RepID=UPI003743A467
MQLRASSLLSVLQLLLLSSSLLARAAPDGSKSNPADKPCTVRSPTTGLYFDLNAISLSPPGLNDGRKTRKDVRTESWHAKGHDYPANFTVNICAPVIEEVTDVVGVEQSRWKNVSAYYELEGNIYSIGEQASQPIFRGRKLVLNYTNGSPCPSSSGMSSLDPRKVLDGHEDNNYDILDRNNSRTKSTIMSFLCDRDPMAPPATVSFVGTMDSCTYFFEVRSPAACGGVAAAPGAGLGPAGVFGVIALIAIAAYLVGGCAYQRTVMHQRGWRQCPNYSLWAGIFGFIKDMTIILFSSLTRCLRLDRLSIRRRVYSRADITAGGVAGARGGIIGAIGGRGGQGTRDVDAENRLIDQLDEEWDD